MNASTKPYLADQTFPARLDQLSAIGELVTAVARRLEMGERDVFAVQMAVDEAATNVMMHGYAGRTDGALLLRCWQEGCDLVIQIRDHGRPFDPDEIPEPDLHTALEDRQEGGLGIFLIRRMMDRVEFVREGDENVLTMVRRCTPGAGLAAGTAVVTPKGRIDAITSPQLERMLRGPLEAAQRFVLVDLAQVTYISSSGLRVLLVTAKELGQRDGSLILCCAQPRVGRVLSMAGFAEILAIFDTRDAALQAMDTMQRAKSP